MAGHNTSAFGIYVDQQAVHEAVNAFKRAGFRSTDISILFPENVGSRQLAHEKHSKAPEGATAGAGAGAGAGAIIGGALGWFVGAGALAIPGAGPLIAAGPVIAALSGIGAGGVVGGFAGALIGIGIPEYEAKRYEGRIRGGGILLSVHCDSSDWTKRAKEVLEQTGANDIATSNEARSEDRAAQIQTPTRAARPRRAY
jgi:hypothetical protein